MCWVKPKACLVPCFPCITVIPSDWGKPDSLPTGLLTAVQTGKDEDGGVFAVVNMEGIDGCLLRATCFTLLLP